MGPRQQRYRDKCVSQGRERVELLVPAEAVPWLKAYASACRHAAELGLPMPRFDGMGAPPSISPAPTRKPSPSQSADSMPDAQHEPETKVLPQHPAKPQPAENLDPNVDGLFQQIEARKQSDDIVDAERPDFTGTWVRKPSTNDEPLDKP